MVDTLDMQSFGIVHRVRTSVTLTFSTAKTRPELQTTIALEKMRSLSRPIVSLRHRCAATKIRFGLPRHKWIYDECRDKSPSRQNE